MAAILACICVAGCGKITLLEVDECVDDLELVLVVQVDVREVILLLLHRHLAVLAVPRLDGDHLEEWGSGTGLVTVLGTGLQVPSTGLQLYHGLDYRYTMDWTTGTGHWTTGTRYWTTGTRH